MTGPTPPRTMEQIRANPQTLDEALLVFQTDPPVLVKDKKGQAGNTPTKYADMVQVNKKVLSKLNALGVIFVGKPTRLADGAFVLDYRLTHVPSGQSETGQYPLPMNDNSQRMGSAISYSRRYVLNAVTGVGAEDEDDDGSASSRTAQRAANARSRVSASTPTGQGQNVAQRQTGGGDPGGPDVPILPGQRGKIVARFDEFGITNRTQRLDITAGIVHRDLGSVNELTRNQAQQVITILDEAATNENPAGFLFAYLPDDTAPTTPEETAS